jgi:hypothetical protein
VKQAINEITASAEQISSMVEQVQKCLDILDREINGLEDPASQLRLREQYRRLRTSLSVTSERLQCEVQKLPTLHLES